MLCKTCGKEITGTEKGWGFCEEAHGNLLDTTLIDTEAPETLEYLFTFSEFLDLCKLGALIDDDGAGEGSDGTYLYKDSYPLYPSDVLSGQVTKELYPYIMWYNK